MLNPRATMFVHLFSSGDGVVVCSFRLTNHYLSVGNRMIGSHHTRRNIATLSHGSKVCVSLAFLILIWFPFFLFLCSLREEGDDALRTDC